MKTRAIHKYLGIILLLPFLAWSATGVFFLLRPQFADAYAQLEARHYPLTSRLVVDAQPDWEELRLLRTVLGEHLLVRQAGSWLHLDPVSLQQRPYPDDAELRLLLNDAIASNPKRYGAIDVLDGRRISTDTGVSIQLDWNTLSFSQQGNDTRWIDRIYSIHYLEWTGIHLLDRVLGVGGLLLLIFMTWTGARMAFGWDRSSKRPHAATSVGNREAGLR